FVPSTLADDCDRLDAAHARGFGAAGLSRPDSRRWGDRSKTARGERRLGTQRPTDRARSPVEAACGPEERQAAESADSRRDRGLLSRLQRAGREGVRALAAHRADNPNEPDPGG